MGIVVEWRASQVVRVIKNPPVNAGDPRKIPWRRARQPTLVFLPGESHGQRSLVGYSPWDRQELDMTEQLSMSMMPILHCPLSESSFVHPA